MSFNDSPQPAADGHGYEFGDDGTVATLFFEDGALTHLKIFDGPLPPSGMPGPGCSLTTTSAPTRASPVVLWCAVVDCCSPIDSSAPPVDHGVWGADKLTRKQIRWSLAAVCLVVVLCPGEALGKKKKSSQVKPCVDHTAWDPVPPNLYIQKFRATPS